MTSEQPWDVRHIYTTADPDFEGYRTELCKMLQASRQAGWIQDLHDCPIGESSGIRPAVQACRWTELVIVDLHGWIGDQGPWLSTTTTPGVLLRDLPANSWSASIIFLTGCRGGTPEFCAQLGRVLTHRTTVVSHFDEAGMTDHTPIDLIKAVLGETAGADAGEALNAVDRALYGRSRLRDEAWMVDQQGPPRH